MHPFLYRPSTMPRPREYSRWEIYRNRCIAALVVVGVSWAGYQHVHGDNVKAARKFRETTYKQTVDGLAVSKLQGRTPPHSGYTADYVHHQVGYELYTSGSVQDGRTIADTDVTCLWSYVISTQLDGTKSMALTSPEPQCTTVRYDPITGEPLK